MGLFSAIGGIAGSFLPIPGGSIIGSTIGGLFDKKKGGGQGGQQQGPSGPDNGGISSTLAYGKGAKLGGGGETALKKFEGLGKKKGGFEPTIGVNPNVQGIKGATGIFAPAGYGNPYGNNQNIGPAQPIQDPFDRLGSAIGNAVFNNSGFGSSGNSNGFSTVNGGINGGADNSGQIAEQGLF